MNSAGSIQRKGKMDELEELPSTSRRCFDDIKVQFGNFKVKQSGRSFLPLSAGSDHPSKFGAVEFQFGNCKAQTWLLFRSPEAISVTASSWQTKD
jgi:hypothetical protein